MARPEEDHFYRPSTRRKIPHPAEQLSTQRTLPVYSAAKTLFSSPIFSAAVGDALTLSICNVQIIITLSKDNYSFSVMKRAY
jgi:hypothetical protein